MACAKPQMRGLAKLIVGTHYLPLQMGCLQHWRHSQPACNLESLRNQQVLQQAAGRHSWCNQSLHLLRNTEKHHAQMCQMPILRLAFPLKSLTRGRRPHSFITCGRQASYAALILDSYRTLDRFVYSTCSAVPPGMNLTNPPR